LAARKASKKIKNTEARNAENHYVSVGCVSSFRVFLVQIERRGTMFHLPTQTAVCISASNLALF